eukprot:2843042-Rhodomonas_salina.1
MSQSENVSWETVLGEDLPGTDNAGQGIRTIDLTGTSTEASPIEAQAEQRATVGSPLPGPPPRAGTRTAPGGSVSLDAGLKAAAQKAAKGATPKTTCCVCLKTVTKTQMAYMVNCRCGKLAVH